MESIKGLSTRKKVLGVSAILVVLLTGLLLWIFFGNASNNPANVLGRDLPIVYSHSDPSIDVHNPRALVGDADYVFVGEVVGVTGTEYTGAINYPYTNYEVEVLLNIKGELVLEKIPVKKIDRKSTRLNSSHT